MKAVPTGVGVAKRPQKLFSALALSLSLFTVSAGLTVAEAALSARTADTIQGSNPYIELNGVKATDLSSLLSITVGGDTYISDAAGNMQQVGAGGVLTPVTLITLPSVGDAFNSVGSIVPPNTASYALNNVAVIPATARKDDEGDGAFTITGNLQGEWKDKNGHSVGTELTGIPSACLAPYTLMLTTTGSPSISTQYGDPRQTSYGNSSAKFTINPAYQPTICFARPDMIYATGSYAGPDYMWDGGTTGGQGTPSNGRGFKLQSSSDYSQNFPTTGANNLYFDLDIGGVASALTWPPVTVGNITATMTNITNTSVRVTLTGPVASSTGVGATAPVPGVLPAPFELVGNNASGLPVVKYGFTLKKWYVNRGSQGVTAANQASWCSGLAGANYVLPKVADLTNANGSGWTGAMPPSSGNHYMRYIGGGLFSEWGSMDSYTGAGFENHFYWTSDTSVTYQFYVNSDFGMVFSANPASSIYGVCTQP